MPDRPAVVPEMVEDRIAARFDQLTPSERMLAGHLSRNYPVAGLDSMPQLAREAGVSVPTVLRLVQKLGFRGYPEFQAQVRSEVESRLESPISKHARWSRGVPQTHMLNRFADAVLTNLSLTLSRVDHAEFDACADMLAQPERRIFVAGGRITRALAEYLVTQLEIVRTSVFLMPQSPNAWPPVLLDLREGDVLIIFDIRRYELAILQLCEMAAGQGVDIVLFTDPWVSPIAAHTRFRFSAQIEVPSAWDSSAALLVLTETMLAAVQENCWPTAEARMKRLEDVYEASRLFRRSKSIGPTRRGWDEGVD